MRRRLAGLALGVAVAIALPAAWAAEPGQGGSAPALPLTVEFSFPPDGAGFANPNVTAVVHAFGQSLAFFSDDLLNGTLENATLDASGVAPNASAGPANASYTSPIFVLPNDLPQLEWTSSVEFLTTGTAANLSGLLRIDVRFGDRSLDRNWSAWVQATVDGQYGDPQGPGNQSLRHRPALQCRFTFLDPQSGSNPHLSSVELWFVAHITSVDARLMDGPWSALGTKEGLYNFSATLPPGASFLEARVTDALGAVRAARANLTYDTVRPTVESAPPSGSSIPPNEAAVIVFSEPIDRASASVHLTVSAPFPVDTVWSADNRTLLVSAQEAGRRGQVTVVLGARLRDRVGNEMGQEASYTYEMGRPAQSQGDILPLVTALLALVGAVAIVVLLLSARAKAKKQAYAKEVMARVEAARRGPPEP